MRKIDCFTFLNGFDVLKLRFAELSDSIDMFVLIESPYDLQGHPKPLYYKENPIRGYNVKYVSVEPKWTGAQLHNKTELAWDNHAHIIEIGLAEALKDEDASTIGYFSDFDEIMRPSKLLEGPLDRPVAFEMELYVYWLNCKAARKNDATCRVPLEQVKSYFSAMMYRYAPKENKISIPDAGWHFTSFGDIDLIMEKLQGYPDNPQVQHLSRDEVLGDMLAGRDFSDFGAGKVSHPIGPLSDNLPAVIQEDPKKWLHFMHPDWRDVV